jgi:adenosylcobinamide-GDP ribazoletransferase
MSGFLTALQFLTVIPVRPKSAATDRDLAGSMAYFPLVGLLIGAALALFYNILNLVFSDPVTCAFILILNAMITGGLHIDGLIDTFDGIASGAEKKRMLEIMREGRPGAIGIASAILLFLAKYSLLVSLPKGTVEVSLIAMTTLGRWSLVASCGLYPYARDGEGLGGRFIRGLTWKEGFASTAFALLVMAFIFRSKIFILIPIVAVLVVGFNLYFCRKIGGITGDTLGALNEITEVLTLALAVVLI